MSAPFTVSNGVRQDGILSLYLFNVYMDDLSCELNACKIGCITGAILINHLMYADDLVIMCPYSRGLARLLKICSKYGIENDIRYNSTKSIVMIIRSKQKKKLTMPKFHLNGVELPANIETVYLGNFITEDFHDDRDIQRQCHKLYSQGNMFVRKFSMCSPDVNVSLFHTFCTPMYTAHLWCNYYAYSMNQSRKAFNEIMRMLLGLPQCHSAS